LLKHETAGDPMSHLKWTRKTTGKIAQQLQQLDIQVCANTVGRLLYDMGYSLRVNHKTLESGNKNPPPRRVRDRQFHYIGKTREEFAARHSPIISVDTKKKELIGPFKNPGTSWEKEPRRVNDHDFRSDAEGMMIPYGIYDPETNRGFVVVGTHRETPAFAVDAILLWWNRCGSRMYVGGGEKGYQFGGREGAMCGVTLWPPMGAEIGKKLTASSLRPDCLRFWPEGCGKSCL